MSNHRIGLACCFLGLVCSAIHAETNWQTQRVHDRFYTEGGSAGDIDGDGVVDVVSGPHWFRGPTFEASFEFAPVKEFPVQAYSDHFFSHVVDVNGDGAQDVIVIGFPGKAARLYVNPGHQAHQKADPHSHWPMHEITGGVDNESPAVVDLIPGGAPEIVCGHDSHYGYFSPDGDPKTQATKPWKWTSISRADACPHRFTHGMGVGDVNGDGQLDVLDKTYWWEQPANASDQTPWKKHQWSPGNYGGGGAQICVFDVDGDGDSDIVTSLNAHGYGLSWFEQQSVDQFLRHDIMGAAPKDSPHGVAFSQMHGVDMKDIDGDGIRDIITGKRYFAHGGKDPGGMDEPVLYWFQCVRENPSVRFIPHLIDRDSGVGVEVHVGDLNGDARPDIISSSKKGLTIHIQKASHGDTSPPSQ